MKIIRNIKKLSLVISLAFFSVVNIYSYELEDILPKETVEKLRKTGHIERVDYMVKELEYTFLPNTPLGEVIYRSWKLKDIPAYSAEEIYLLHKKDLGNGKEETTNIEYTSKILRSVSKLQGVTYYSHNEKKTKVLYKDCYCIKGPKDKTKVPDDTNGNADGKVLYCLQNDNSFGKTNYRLEYHQKENEICAFFTNITGLHVGPFKAVEDEHLIISLLVVDCGEDLLVYMTCNAKIIALESLKETVKESFGSRLDTIYKWYVEQY